MQQNKSAKEVESRVRSVRERMVFTKYLLSIVSCYASYRVMVMLNYYIK